MTDIPSPQPAHTPGPWTVSELDARGEVSEYHIFIEPGVAVIERCVEGRDQFDMPNARLIAAAPDYHDAAFWIRQAVAANAAPVNPLAALEELALDGEHITLDAGLVLDLLKAHAKATGDQA